MTKSVYTKQDCKALRNLLVSRAKEIAENGKENYILLSGGMDSLTVVYAFMEAGLPFTAVNFRMKDIPSYDYRSVKRLEEKAGIKCVFVEIPSDFAYIKKKLPQVVDLCDYIYGRVREVKCETLYAILETKPHIPEGSNVISGMGGDAVCGYHRDNAIEAAKKGDDDPSVLKLRNPSIDYDECTWIFRGTHDYFDFYNSKAIIDYMSGFKVKAISKNFAKSFVYFAFADYHKKYNSYREPIGFHKASHEKELFASYAKENGFFSVANMFEMLRYSESDIEIIDGEDEDGDEDS